MTDKERTVRLEDLYSRIRKDPSYRNSKMADVFVPGRGDLNKARVVLVGEAPGRNEEIAGLPFVGAAGKNLDTLLQTAGLSRDDLFITNVIKYRPVDPQGKNRNPTSAESDKALPFLLEELQILQPKLTVCLGRCPARTLLGGYPIMSKMNGEIFSKHGLRIMVTYHPSPFNFMIAKKREEMHRAFMLLRDFRNAL